ncbi:LysR family transcriptional regulator [Streptomyces aureoverticillatus]|uniref:LysR family transcriptional regulator n=1 Tax=Streptomyces aureoverticillatus TaxID=66871 RepID=UPI0013D943D7|nr:LysR family transcriptional regulator [Streptomyces aureoverticillatus]QIB45235.1 LysR family transcriptional regulator [Streptomyces aureoverticillatus]
MNWTSSQLRSLTELDRRGTITAVAAALGYTPGGVSQQIAALERATGRKLLRRVGRRVELTEAGRALARHADRILAAEAEAVAAVERTRTEITGVLRVALFATAAAEILPQALRAAREAHPGLEVRSRDMEVDDVYDAVVSGAVDLALGLDYPDVPIPRDPALRIVPLHTERFALAVPPGTFPEHGSAQAGAWAASAGLVHPADPANPADPRKGLPTSTPLPLDLRRTEPHSWILPPADTYYGRAVRTACRRAGVEPSVRHEVTDTAATLALVEAGVGISTVTDLMLRLRPSHVDVLPLREPLERHIVMIYRTTAESLPTLTSLIPLLQSPPLPRPPQPNITPAPPSATLS